MIRKLCLKCRNYFVTSDYSVKACFNCKNAKTTPISHEHKFVNKINHRHEKLGIICTICSEFLSNAKLRKIEKAKTKKTRKSKKSGEFKEEKVPKTAKYRCPSCNLEILKKFKSEHENWHK